MTYEKALEYMENISTMGIVPGLDSMKRLCQKLDNPQNQLSFVHIAGTNGKGSILAYISTICTCAGMITGRYCSPTIFEYRERFQINGKMITKKDFADGVALMEQKCQEIVQEGFPHPTAFEVDTALAFWYFHKKQCQIVVLETGMGGLEDATNIIQNTLVTVIASIGYDHMQFLGNTIEKIAAQKAGIIKPGARVVCMKQEPVVEEIILEQAERMKCPVTMAGALDASHIRYGIAKQSFQYKQLKGLKIALAGKHQIDNACVAVEAICQLSEAMRERALGNKQNPISSEDIEKGLAATVWPGRFSVVQRNPLVVCDGAHNEDAAKKLADSIEFYFTNKRIIYIMGILKDKEVDKVIKLTCKYAEHIITITPPNQKRALPSYELAKRIMELHPEAAARLTAADSLEDAYELAKLLASKEDVILAFGSLSYLGQFIKLCEGAGKRRS